MALDSAGYNPANAFSANNAFAMGLQKAAVYDPTQQSSALQTSAAGTLNSQNTDQESSNATQNTQSTPTAGLLSTATNNMAFPTWAGLGAQSKATQTTLQNAGTATTQVANPLYNLGGDDPTSGVSAGGINPLTGQITDANGQPQTIGQTVQAQTPVTTTYNPNLVAPNAARNPTTAGGVSIATSGGYQTVSVRTSDGQFAYYTFNPQTGTYVYAATYDKNGTQTGGGQVYYDQNGVQHRTSSITQQDRAGAYLANLGAGVTFNSAQAQNNANLVTQSQAANITAWTKANQDAITAQTTANTASQSAAILAYMQANGGQLPPQQAGTSGAYQYSNAAVAAAQTQYAAYQQQRAAEDANAAILGQYANKPIDTAAVDATSQAANEALVSQGATINGGADAGAGSRLGATNSAAVIGQGTLNHQTAAAQSYYTNMQAFGQALQAQASNDANATATKLNADVQNVSDVASALEQQLSSLDAATQLRVKGQLDNLQNQIAQYQYAMQHYKDNTALIHSLAIGILALGGAIATVATGGLAGVGIAAATAGVAAAGAKA